MQAPRITSGIAKGKRLKVPKIKNFRAVQDVAKLAIFSILGDKTLKSECLDLYAGSGNLGIEALSRGAKSCDFVDHDRKAIDTIKENLKNLNLSEKAEVFQEEATKFVAGTQNQYDIVFVDPFFDDTAHRYLLGNLPNILKDNGVIFFSHGKNLKINEQIINTPLTIYDQRKYNNAFITILQRND